MNPKQHLFLFLVSFLITLNLSAQEEKPPKNMQEWLPAGVADFRYLKKNIVKFGVGFGMSDEKFITILGYERFFSANKSIVLDLEMYNPKMPNYGTSSQHYGFKKTQRVGVNNPGSPNQAFVNTLDTATVRDEKITYFEKNAYNIRGHFRVYAHKSKLNSQFGFFADLGSGFNFFKFEKAIRFSENTAIILSRQFIENRNFRGYVYEVQDRSATGTESLKETKTVLQINHSLEIGVQPYFFGQTISMEFRLGALFMYTLKKEPIANEKTFFPTISLSAGYVF